MWPKPEVMALRTRKVVKLLRSSHTCPRRDARGHAYRSAMAFGRPAQERPVGGALRQLDPLGIAITNGGRLRQSTYRSSCRIQGGSVAVVAPRIPGTAYGPDSDLGCVTALLVASGVPVGGLAKGLPLFGAGFLTMCLPAGVLAGV